MDMNAFAYENWYRCTATDGFNHPIESWSLSDWMTATMGELGEAANIVKKMNRIRDNITNTGDPNSVELRQMLSDELADTYIYLDLLAQAAGFKLADIVASKFEKTSQKIGYSRDLSHVYFPITEPTISPLDDNAYPPEPKEPVF